MKMKWRIKQLIALEEEKTGRLIRYQDIALAVGVSPNTLSKLNQGKARMVGINTIEQLCKFFQCTPNDLMIIE